MDQRPPTQDFVGREWAQRWSARFGLALPYVVALVGWAVAPASFKKHYDPAGEAYSNGVNWLILIAFAAGLALAIPWMKSRPRSFQWWFGAIVAAVIDLMALSIFSLYVYLYYGGAFP